ncbi:MAG: transglutaminase-like domain-containing protein [Pseudohongiellaceae bacterium]
MPNTAPNNTATPPTSLLPISLRALVIATSFWALSLSLTVPAGSVAAVIGCLLACYCIDLAIHRHPLYALRTITIVLAALTLPLISVVAARLMLGSTFLADLFTPIALFNIGEFVTWFSIGLGITTALRTLAQRSSFGAVLEIVWVAAAFVIVLSAHRNGMIHRPYFIGDFAYIRGIDPSHILMGIGCVAVLSLSALLIVENNQRRLPYHFAVLSLLCLTLFSYVQLFGLPTPQITDDLGLTGQEQGTGSSRRQDNPFTNFDSNTSGQQGTPVAVVVFRDDYEPLNGNYYFRESAYSQFNGVRLDYSRRDDMDRDLIPGFTSTRTDAELLPGARDQRSAVRTTVGMLIPHRNPFGLTSPVAYTAIPNPNTLRFRHAYDVESLAPHYDLDYLLDRELGNPDWTTDVHDEYLKLPDDPRYQEFAESLLAGLRPEYADDPFAKAWTVKIWLDENGIYSLENEHAAATDPAASFLFGDLTGYCMHFSFAATYLYRSIGIPARVGVGYAVPAENRADGSALLVQAMHAHAWPEVYFQDIGWVIIDPAPQQALTAMTSAPLDNLQQLLGDMLRDDASFNTFLQSQQQAWIPWQTMLQALYAALLLTLLLAYGIKWYRQLLPRYVTNAAQYRHAYRAVLDYLAGFGIRRDYGESREEFARRIRQLSPTFAQLTAAHLRQALGQPQAHEQPQAFEQSHTPEQPQALEQPQTPEHSQAPEQKTVWSDLRVHTAQELKQNTKLWQRALTFFNPVSWLWSR